MDIVHQSRLYYNSKEESQSVGGAIRTLNRNENDIKKQRCKMAYVTCKLRSAELDRNVEIKLYFPCDLPVYVGAEMKGTLTLLHGYGNSGDDWTQMTAAARYAADNGLVLICPSCQNSFYQDTFRSAWKTFVTEEMPLLLSRMFHFPREREKNFIAGLSMGGYGALYLAF